MFKKLADIADKAKTAIHDATAPKKEEAAKKEAEPAAAAAAAPAAEEAKVDPEVEAQEAAKTAARERAARVRAAIEGAGTDEAALIAELAPLNPTETAALTEAYTEAGHDLIKDLKGDLSGRFEDVLVGLVTPAGVWIADEVHRAVKGMGCDEKRLIETLCTASDEDIKAANVAYRKRHDGILYDVVEGETSGKLKEILTTVIRAAISEAGRPSPVDDADKLEEDVLRLYNAGENKVGTSESVFINIIAENGRGYVEAVAHAYAKKYGKSLPAVIKAELSGDTEDALLALCRPVYETFSDTLYKAMKGMGTDDDALVRVITGQRHHLREIQKYFLHEHDKSLIRWVKGEVSGDLEDALVAILEAYDA